MDQDPSYEEGTERTVLIQTTNIEVTGSNAGKHASYGSQHHTACQSGVATSDGWHTTPTAGVCRRGYAMLLGLGWLLASACRRLPDSNAEAVETGEGLLSNKGNLGLPRLLWCFPPGCQPVGSGNSHVVPVILGVPKF